jgi:putative YphP/YqiW family bacilliredoxin
MPPSSPSFALMRDGKLLQMIHRADIEIRGPQEVAAMLMALFDRYCTGAAPN